MSLLRLLSALVLTGAWAQSPAAYWAPLRLAAVAGPRPYQADAARSTVRFRAAVNEAFIKEVKATFHRFSFAGAIDGENPERSSAKLTLAMDSVTSDTFGVSDSRLRDELNVRTYPEAVVETTAVRRAGPDAYDVDILARYQGQELRSTLRLKVVRFQNYLRLLGTYSTQPDSKGRKADIEFSLYAAPQ